MYMQYVHLHACTAYRMHGWHAPVLCTDADVPSDAVCGDGYVDLESTETVAISGLDGYHVTKTLGRWSYAKTNCKVSQLQDPVRGWEDVSS